MDLTDRTVVVTGAGRGIGRAAALGFARRGADVALVARTSEQIEEVAGRVRSGGRRAVAVTADVTDRTAIADMVARVRSELGGIDILINNAGAAAMAPIESLDPDDWRRMVRVNLEAVLLVTQAVWPELKRRGGGMVVNVSSLAAFDPFVGFAGYAATKAAVNTLTRALAQEGAASNIRLFSVCPGAVDTAMFRSLGVSVPKEQILAPEEIADFMVYLTDPRCRHLSGESLIFNKRPGQGAGAKGESTGGAVHGGGEAGGVEFR